MGTGMLTASAALINATPLEYLAILFFTAGTLKFLESHVKSPVWKKFFNYIPAVVCLYLVTMVLGSINLWPDSDALKTTAATVQTQLLPPMIFLLLLRSDLRQIIKLGPRMIAVFVIAAGGMMLGFIVAFAIFKTALNDPDAWKTLSALCGSWIGGSVNMAAIQGALDIPGSAIGYVLSIDTISYAVWLILMLVLVPWAKYFNRWTKADSSELEKIIEHLEQADQQQRKNITFADIIFLFSIAVAASAISFYAADLTAAFFERHVNIQLLSTLQKSSLWVVLYATVFGVLGGMTKLGKLPGSLELGNTMLYLFIAVIGSRVNLQELDMRNMAIYLLLGIVVLLVHFGVLSLAAKIFKFDAFSCQTASLANIGGVASATVISGAYSASLVPIGVLMASLGTIMGTGCGLIVAKIIENI